MISPRYQPRISMKMFSLSMRCPIFLPLSACSWPLIRLAMCLPLLLNRKSILVSKDECLTTRLRRAAKPRRPGGACYAATCDSYFRVGEDGSEKDHLNFLRMSKQSTQWFIASST